MLGLIAVFAIARVTLGIRSKTAGDQRSTAVTLVREYLDAFIVAGLVAMLLTTFVIRTYYIPTVSMVPTLQVGDVLLVSELEYHLHPPRSGDVAVFMPPIDSGGDEFIKRVIGVPGDTIRISEGIVYRNGRALREPYENEPPQYDLEIKNYSIYVDGIALDPRKADIPPKSQWTKSNRIPAGYYFMLGDNRNYSDDSHAWGFAQMRGRYASGPLAHRDVTASFAGRAFMIFWPLSHFSVLH